MAIIRVAIYCRLSEEDKNKQNSFDESESIQNQKSMLLSYAIEQNWDIYKIYCDEDYSGADESRPEFCQMIEDAENKKFSIILCKTQSRFTRDMELVEKYLHNKFPQWNIRFISLLDNADTHDRYNKKSRQINGLINEWYLEDISENIKAVFKNKHREGKSTHSFLPYGYLKHPQNKNKIIIDPNTAQIVKDIFSLYISGLSTTKIASILNERKVLPPQQYKNQIGIKLYNPNKNKLNEWGAAAITRIIRNQMYIGDLVQNTHRKMSYKSKKIVSNPKEKWTIVPNTHEAVVDRETFRNAQNIMDSKIKPSKNGIAHIFAKKVRCMACGGIFHKSGKKYKNKEYSYLRCRSAKCQGNRICFSDLEEIISSKIKCHLSKIDSHQIANLAEFDAPIKARLNQILNNLKLAENELEKKKNCLKGLYSDKTNKIISNEEFLELKTAFNAELQMLKERRALLENERNALEEKQVQIKDKIKLIEEYKNFEKPSKIIINEFIDFIEIGEELNGSRQIRIHWLF